MSKQEQMPERKSEIEITEHDREMMQRNLGLLRSRKEWGSFIEAAGAMKVLFPEMDPEKDLGADEEAKREIKELLDKNQERKHQDFDWAASMKILWPEIDSKKDLGLSRNAQAELRANLREFRGPELEAWSEFAADAASGKIIWPELDAKRNLGVNEEAIAGMKEELKKQREMRALDDKEGYWEGFFALAKDIRILCPEMDPEKDLGIDDEARDGADRYAEFFRKKDEWSDFSELALARKVAEAKKVEVTDKGLKVE